jgi:tRNA G46 methylase TrmB
MEKVQLNETKRFCILAIDPVRSHHEEVEHDEEEEAVDAKRIFHQIYAEDSYELASKFSTNERKLLSSSRKNFTLTYGEILYDSFIEILTSVLVSLREQGSEKIFIDLGSGTGKASLITALSSNFQSCVGIEIMSSLHTLALQSLESWKVQEQLFLSTSSHQPTKIEFLQGSFLDLNFFDWTIGDLVFANSTCYGHEIMAQISTYSGRDV